MITTFHEGLSTSSAVMNRFQPARNVMSVTRLGLIQQDACVDDGIIAIFVFLPRKRLSISAPVPLFVSLSSPERTFNLPSKFI